jgi:hypothetical protein
MDWPKGLQRPEIIVAPKLSVREADVIAKHVEESMREHVRLLSGVVVRARLSSA